jgi:hypothetical protein
MRFPRITARSIREVIAPPSTPSGLRPTSSRKLSGGWDDAGIDAMAQEDGQAQLYTSTWGEGNKEPRGILANNAADATAQALIAQQLYQELTDVEQQLEGQHPRFQRAQSTVLSQIDRVERADTRVEQLEERFEAEDVEVPAAGRGHHAKEFGALAALGSGDLVLNTAAFQLFGLSDRNFGPLPLSELALAASVTVFALMFLARSAGSTLKTFTHLVGVLLFHRSDADEEQANRRRLARAVVAGSLCLVWLAAGVALLWAIGSVRSNFLQQQGIGAHTATFFMIQLGVFVAGVAMSFHFSHAYETEWKRTCLRLNAVSADLAAGFEQLLVVVSTYNGLIRLRENLLAQYREWALATTADTRRQNELYSRRALLAQPEPTSDELFAKSLPEPATGALVTRVGDYLEGDAQTFKRYEPLTISSIEKRLADIELRREQRRAARHDVAEGTRRPVGEYVDISAISSNGNGKHAAVAP